MSVIFSAVKSFVFIFNLICLILGIGTIAISALGLEDARPGTDEHSYFIVGIILGSLVCMSTFFGCYGVVCELLGVNIVYGLFLLVLLVVQVFQVQSFQPHIFYGDTVERLDLAWRLVETKPNMMQTLEENYRCCALNNSRDYSYRGLNIPNSCYYLSDAKPTSNLYTRGCLEAMQNSYQFAVHRDKLFNWALIIAEFIALLYSMVLSVILFRQNHINAYQVLRPERELRIPRTNHVDYRTFHLSH